ncbi:MAG TPA: glycosyltransferase family 2 protein [Patescibacteria group bacterium]|nr:glycosyltransferase family 2 protein [Patescibacteria group bacterium]
MIELSIIIVSYNSGEFLRKCLESIQESKFKNLEVIVVDNASKDNPEKIIKDFPNVIFIKNKENLGFSKANNLGLKKASGKYVLFLNPDTAVGKNALGTLFSFMEETPDAGVVTCKVVLPNGELDDSCHRGYPTPWNAICFFSGLEKLFPHSKLFAGYHMGWMDYSKIHEINACAGSFMLVRRKAGEDIGWWDEDFFFYGEDLDFCLKIREKEWKIYYYPQVSTVHYKGVSSGIKKISKEITTADLETKRFAMKHRFSAMKILYKKHYMDKYPKIVTWLLFQAINFKYWLALKSL